MLEEPKPLKKKQQIKMDEEYARKLHAEINKDIDWDVAIDHVKLKAKEYLASTPLAKKVPVVDYEIIELNNKPYYKIIRADGTHQLYISFLNLPKNFDKEDLEALWSLVKERLKSGKLKGLYMVKQRSRAGSYWNHVSAPKYHKCNRVGHLAHDYRSSANANTANNQRGTWAGQKPICFQCVAQGHFKRECPKLKNNNHGNQGGNGNPLVKVYAVGHVGTNPDSNGVT
nr:hypothetical protein [Tanacetum cinerariifolium]